MIVALLLFAAGVPDAFARGGLLEVLRSYGASRQSAYRGSRGKRVALGRVSDRWLVEHGRASVKQGQEW